MARAVNVTNSRISPGKRAKPRAQDARDTRAYKVFKQKALIKKTKINKQC